MAEIDKENIKRMSTGINHGAHPLAKVIAEKTQISKEQIRTITHEAQDLFNQTRAIDLADGAGEMTLLSEEEFNNMPELTPPKTERLIGKKNVLQRAAIIQKIAVENTENINSKQHAQMEHLMTSIDEESIEQRKENLADRAKKQDIKQEGVKEQNKSQQQTKNTENLYNNSQSQQKVFMEKWSELEQGFTPEKITETLSLRAAERNLMRENLDNVSNQFSKEMEQLDIAIQNVAQHKATLLEKFGNVNQASDDLKETFLTNINAATEKLTKSDHLLKEIKNIPVADPQSVKKDLEQINLHGRALLDLVIGMFIETNNNASVEKLNNNRDRIEKIQLANINELKVKEQEATEAAEKAAKLGKIGTCIAKVLTYLIVAVSVIGAVFTAGASLAIAAIGIALLVTDSVMEAAGVESLSSRMMSPLMTEVIQPAIKWLTEAFVKILKETGLGDLINKAAGKDITEIIATALAAVTAIIGMVVLMVVAKVGGSFIAKQLGPMFTKIMSKIATSAFATAIKNFGQNISKFVIKKIPEKLKEWATQLNEFILKTLVNGNTIAYTKMSLTVANASVKAGFDINKGVSDKYIYDLRASMMGIEKIAEILQELSSEPLKKFMESFDVNNVMTKTLYDSINNTNKTAQAILA
ncbi:Secretion system effector C (SseC) like family protein [Candidatus Regiella insecticola 5.15]|uniref:Secretion system effector C (SseC) like family protein n=1 Tax=Candidatus Regiella insecticola 5.15 TaxID=1005043 RepID=G2GYS7_9ENTR|nr:type III secretion system translocon subunit SctE [Candidatus Regiella insecticola]EGY29099.1 Secretion system effector C (SseC) like family protein [Candidatus Regiella insecticola 5.15]